MPEIRINADELAAIVKDLGEAGAELAADGELLMAGRLSLAQITINTLFEALKAQNQTIERLQASATPSTAPEADPCATP